MRMFRFLLPMLGGVLFSGCGPASSESKTVREISAATRPPLKVWIVDAPELEKEISIRWQASSDQALQIEHFPIDAFASREPFVADVVIYPGTLLGDLVQKEAIAPLPSQAMANRETPLVARGANETSAADLASREHESWPLRWRNISTFGGRLYAVPLGATRLAATMVGLDSRPFSEIDNALTDTRDLNELALEHWETFLKQAESKLADSLNERSSQLAERLSKLSSDERDWLVDCFMFIASTTNARRSGLFDLIKMNARLSELEFSNSARILARLVQLFPESIAISPTEAWAFPLSKVDRAAAFAIGWPSSVIGEATDPQSDATLALEVSPLAWNPGTGLIASVGKKTRQTSVSCAFLLWLSEPEQREALRAVCSRIELNANQHDRNNVREDYRAYQAINSRESRVESTQLILRLANANKYRMILADGLLASIREPDRIDGIMDSCAVQWDQLTAKLGIERQRISEEQSLGYRQ